MATLIDRKELLPSNGRNAAAGRSISIFTATVAFLAFYIIAFPKGGLKVGGIPITIGYAFTALLLLLAILRAGRMTLPLDRLLAFAPCVLLALWSAMIIAVNGVQSASFMLAYFISLLYLPVFGLTVFSPLILDEHRDLIERAFLWAVRFIVAYGIFLFIFRQTTGQWIEIPYLTVNVDDVGQLDDKFINRGGVFKLISTYNNGNIFGISLAMMAPLYLRLESRRVLSLAMYAALFLTLSRTVWIALLLIVFLDALSKGIRPLTLLYLTVGITVATAIILALVQFLGADMSFIFDRNLGGRINQLDVIENIRLIPEEPVAPLPEIVYLGALQSFGVLGLLLFVVHLLAPSLLLMAEGTRVLSRSKASACLQGLLIYAIIAWADAAYFFIPVMMVFWMMAGLGFWYAHRQARLMKGPREAAR